VPEHTGAGECREASDMVVTGMLAWYDEDPAILYRAVRSLDTIADHLVAVDGRWNLYPGQTVSSPPEQAQAIREAAHDAGITADIHPAQEWTGQVAKRNRMLWIASNTSDWVLPLDADWELVGNRTKVRAELEHAKADALTVPFHTPANPDAELDPSPLPDGIATWPAAPSTNR
jgi:hypothetical protein